MLKEEKEEKYCHKTETKQFHFIFLLLRIRLSLPCGNSSSEVSWGVSWLVGKVNSFSKPLLNS